VTRVSRSAQFLTKLSFSLRQVRSAYVALLSVMLPICAAARAQVNPVTVATDKSVQCLSNQFGVPFSGTSDLMVSATDGDGTPDTARLPLLSLVDPAAGCPYRERVT
jgi:hypothetical protein